MSWHGLNSCVQATPQKRQSMEALGEAGGGEGEEVAAGTPENAGEELVGETPRKAGNRLSRSKNRRVFEVESSQVDGVPGTRRAGLIRHWFLLLSSLPISPTLP